MSKTRFCDNCVFLNKRKKKNPCNKNFTSTYDYITKKYIRDNKCKNKTLKIDKNKLLKKIKEETVDIFQKYIRYRDNFTCCCCGFFIDPNSKDAIKLMHAGHFLSRTIKPLLMDEKNVNAQCRNCNAQQDWLGVDPRYCSYMIKKYGVEVFDYLYNKKIQNWQEPTYEQWVELKKYWQNKLEEIKNARNK